MNRHPEDRSSMILAIGLWMTALAAIIGGVMYHVNDADDDGPSVARSTDTPCALVEVFPVQAGTPAAEGSQVCIIE